MINESGNIAGNAGNSYFHYIGLDEADIKGFVQVPVFILEILE